MKKMLLKDFITENIQELKEKITRKTQLIWTGRTYEDLYPRFTSKLYPLEEQKKIIGQIVDGITKNNLAFLSGEMGTGKTLMSIYAAAVLHKMKRKGMRILVVAPANLIKNPWKEHLERIVPYAKIRIIDSLKAFLELKKLPKVPANNGLEFVIISETLWKGMVHSEKTNSVSHTEITEIYDEEDASGNQTINIRRRKKKTFTCPECFGYRAVEDEFDERCTIHGKFVLVYERKSDLIGDVHAAIKKAENIASDSGTPAIKHRRIKVLTKEAYECPKCKSLWINKEIKKYPLADIYKDYLKSYFQLAIIDEGSMYRNDSQRGLTLGKLKCPVLIVSGTFITGYASSLFYTNMQLLGGFWRKRGFTFKSERKFQETYGFMKRKVDTTRVKRNNKFFEKLSYAPGVKPELIAIMRRYVSFISLSDMVKDLPPYKEIFVPVKMTQEMTNEYRRFIKEITETKNAAGIVVNAISLPDLMFQENIYNDVVTNAVESVLPKERKLAEIINREKKENRKCLIYPIFTQRRDVSRRLVEVLKSFGIKAALLDDRVKPEDREKVLKEYALLYDAVVVQPRKVQYGTNLQVYPTIIWYQPTYDPDLFKQASRRSYRADQTKEVRVYQMYYDKTIQEKAFELINEKDVIIDLFNGILSDKLDFALKTKNSVIAQLYKELKNEEVLFNESENN